MNTLMMQMRHTAHELRVTLDHVLQGGETAGAPQSSQDETMSFLTEPEVEMRTVHHIPEVSSQKVNVTARVRKMFFCMHIFSQILQ